MAKKCMNCEKTMKLIDSNTISINGKYYDVCNKCYEQINKMHNLVKNSKTSDELLKNKEKVFIILNDEQYNDLIKENILNFLIPLSEKRIKDSEEKKKADIALQEAKAKQKKEFIEKVKHFKVTSGYNFEGYNIKNYIGIVSGEVVIGTGYFSEFLASASDLFGTTSTAFSDKMGLVKDKALEILIQKAISKGANAVIGIDFDYLTFANNMMGVSANATAVVIEETDKLPEL